MATAFPSFDTHASIITRTRRRHPEWRYKRIVIGIPIPQPIELNDHAEDLRILEIAREAREGRERGRNQNDQVIPPPDRRNETEQQRRWREFENQPWRMGTELTQERRLTNNTVADPDEVWEVDDVIRTPRAEVFRPNYPFIAPLRRQRINNNPRAELRQVEIPNTPSTPVDPREEVNRRATNGVLTITEPMRQEEEAIPPSTPEVPGSPINS